MRPQWWKAVSAAGLTVAVVLGAWSIAIEPDHLFVNPLRVHVPGAPPGLKVVVLADVHGGAPHVTAAKLRKVVGVVNGLDPDVVVFLGDLVIHGVVGGRFMDPEPAARELGAMTPRLGKVAVLGNHDWWLDGPRVRRALEAGGFRVLENDVTSVDRGGVRLWFAGLADLWTRQPDIEGTLAKIPAGEPLVLLTHNPDLFPNVPARVALTLAGHTHGGQVRIPLLGPPIVPSAFGQRYAAGMIEEDGRRMFVTTGIGTSILPVRFRVPPEIAVITLED